MQTNSTQRGETMKKVIFSFLSVACATSLVYGAPNLSENAAENSSVNSAENSANLSENLGATSQSVNSAENSAENSNLNSSGGENLGENSAQNSQNSNAATSQSVNLSANSVNSKQNSRIAVAGLAVVKDFDKSTATNAFEALKHTQGVYTQDATGYAPMANVFVRGLDKVGLYLDGISLRDFGMGENDTRFFALQGISHIELYKGYTRAGLSGLGGALNLVSHKPTKEFELSFGARNIYNNSGIGGGVEEQRQVSAGTKRGDFYFNASFFDTQREHLGYSMDYEKSVEASKRSQYGGKFENRVFKVDFGWTPNSDEYSLHYLNQKGARGDLTRDNTITGMVEIGTVGASDEQIEESILLNLHSVYDMQAFYFLGKSYFTPNFSLDSKLFYTKIERKIEQVYFLSGATYPKSDIQEMTGQSLGASLALRYDFAPFANVKFGLSGKNNRQKNELANVFVRYSTHNAFEANEWQSSVFGEFEGKFGDFGLAFNASYDRADLMKANMQLTQLKGDAAVAGDFDKAKHSVGRKFSFGNFSLQALASYDLGDFQQLYASVSKKNEIPNFYDRYFASPIYVSGVLTSYNAFGANANLRPESILAYELGYGLNLPSTKVNVAAFYNDMLDMLSVKAVNAGYELTNKNKGYIYGGELGVEQSVSVWVFGANYSFTQGWFSENDGAGHKLTHYPHHNANAKIGFSPVSELNFSLLGNYKSRVKVPTDNGYKNGREYFTLDLLAKFTLQSTFAKGLSINAGIYNITDRDNSIPYYTATANSVSAKMFEYHFAGRRYFVGFDYKY